MIEVYASYKPINDDIIEGSIIVLDLMRKTMKTYQQFYTEKTYFVNDILYPFWKEKYDLIDFKIFKKLKAIKLVFEEIMTDDG